MKVACVCELVSYPTPNKTADRVGYETMCDRLLLVLPSGDYVACSSCV